MAHPVLLQRKYARVVWLFAQKAGISVRQALDFFYQSLEYELMSEGVSNLHCMSDDYLAEDLLDEWQGHGRYGRSRGGADSASVDGAAERRAWQ